MRARHTLLAAGLVAAVALASAAQPPLRSGIDPTLFDTSVRPQDDLFRYVNGRWLADTEVPADRAVYGTFVQLADKAEADLRALIDELVTDSAAARGTTAQQIRDFYASFMDEAAINTRGADPLKRRLADIDSVKTPTDLATLIGRLSMAGIPGPIGSYVEPDAGDPTTVALWVSQGGTSLPDRDYYLIDEARFADIRAKYVAYLEKVFTLVGRSDAAADARAVLELETRLAKIQWSRVEGRDAVKTYNKFPVSKIVAEMPGFDWVAWARPQGLDKVQEWIVREPSFFTGFAAMVPVTPMETWKAWLAAKLISAQAPLLSQPFAEAAFDFFGRTLSGQQVQRDRWKRGVQLINRSMGEALGQLYVARHFTAVSRARMKALIDNLIEAYRQSITELEWMTPPTRREALAKLAQFDPKIGHPDRWRDYRTLDVRADDLVGNVERANIFDAEYQVSKLGRPVDRGEWLMTPQTVNAYYNPVKNEIVFPAAILQPPFFDVTADDAVNYGAIGAVIGHEIGHGFDDQGRRFDGNGKLRDWWTPADESEFQKRARLLVDQFNSYSPLPGLNVNGELTLGENIGDLGGLSIAYQAWRLSLGGQPAREIDGLSGEQRYFMGWAQAWRAKARAEYLQRQVLADPHAWAEFRANGPLGNIAAFYNAFNVSSKDKLYREPALRVKIW